MGLRQPVNTQCEPCGYKMFFDIPDMLDAHTRARSQDLFLSSLKLPSRLSTSASHSNRLIASPLLPRWESCWSAILFPLCCLALYLIFFLIRS